MHKLLSQRQIDDFARDGAVVVPGLFAGFVELIAEGIEANMADPGPYAAENLKPGETGRFFDDYCNWTRLPPFQNVIANSPVGEVAADLMRSRTAQLFHDHVLVKEPGTSNPAATGQPLFCRRSTRLSVSGARSIQWVRRLRCVADRIDGRVRFCRHAGCPRKISTPTGPTTCRFPTRMPTVWKFSNGRCSPAMPWPSIFAFSMVRGAMKARRAGALFRSGLLVMMHAISTVRDAHRRRSRDMACDPVIACARTGSQLSFAVRYEMSCDVKDGAHA